MAETSPIVVLDETHPLDTSVFDPTGKALPGAQTLPGGRGGSSRFACDGRSYVLRRYLRGGLPARLGLLYDRYLWTGQAGSRPAREKAVVDHALAAGLPVPRVAGYALYRDGPFYRAAIVSEFIPNRGSLAGFIGRQALDEQAWLALGSTLRRFHAAGIDHADLNADNVLLDEHGGFTLIDFDKGQVRRDSGWQQGNLERLRRSLRKIAALRNRSGKAFHFGEAEWSALLRGYESSDNAAR